MFEDERVEKIYNATKDLNTTKEYKLHNKDIITFSPGQAKIVDNNKTIITDLFKTNSSMLKVNIIGYATSQEFKKDAKDNYSSNKQLAQARAQNTKIFILNKNITNIKNIDTSYKVMEHNRSIDNQKVEILIYKK